MDNDVAKRRVVSFLTLLGIMTGFPAQSEAGTITAPEIKGAIIHYVENSMHWPPGSLRIDDRAKINDVVIPGEDIRVAVAARPDQDFIGDTVLAVRYYSGRNLVKEENLRVMLEALKDVVVSTKALTKDKIITAEDVRVEKKWVRRLPEKLATVSDEVIGKALMVNIRQNNEISRNVIKEPRLIKKGSAVRIILDNGDFSISTTGVSEENGTAESLIRVKNVSSNKIIYARVVGDSLVRVEF